MEGFRKRLTYANVVATLALFLALSGGVVWAAHKITSKQIGKGAVKTRNIAKSAVKAKNLAKKSVTSAKLAKGAVKTSKLADGAVNFAKLAAGTNVIASVTSTGPLPANQEGPTNVPLSAPLSLTPVAGELTTVNIEAHATLAPSGASNCSVVVFPLVNGNPMAVGELLVLVSPDNPPEQPFPNGLPQADVSFPVGLTEPGQPQNITLELLGSSDCTSASALDKVAVVATEAK